MSAQIARRAAERLLAKLGVDGVPVNVGQIAKRVGLRVAYVDLADDVSALLVTDKDKTAVGVNANHSRTRQRFSLAHEIGHFVLGHQFELGEHVHVDSGRRISARSTLASAGLDSKEIEANQFAAELLMPTKLVRMHAAEFAGHPLLENEVEALARRFNVSRHAMTIQLSHLGLV